MVCNDEVEHSFAEDAITATIVKYHLASLSHARYCNR